MQRADRSHDLSELTSALRFLRAIDERASTRVERFGFGTAYLCPELPRVWSRNFVFVDRAIAEADLADLVEDADALHAGAGLEHRRLVFSDARSGALAGSLLGPTGWRRDSERLMIHRGPAPDARAAAVHEVEARALDEASRAMSLEHPDVRDEETVEQLLTASRRVATATCERCFAWLEEGTVASFCRLYSDWETAQIEEVGTLPELRGRGYAGAVVGAALSAAKGAHRSTFLLADDSDWPKHWYERLGFEGVGVVHEVLKT
jgi:N-acetylglutamate synthase-like GNAT family acetyltransferase